jgi:hypothetical protein
VGHVGHGNGTSGMKLEFLNLEEVFIMGFDVSHNFVD